MAMNEDDKMLCDAANDYLNKHDFETSMLVRQKKNFMYLTLGDTGETYEMNLSFVKWLEEPIVGTSDSPMSHDNLLIADCIVMAHNGKGGVTPLLMDSRFIEPAI